MKYFANISLYSVIVAMALGTVAFADVETEHHGSPEFPSHKGGEFAGQKGSAGIKAGQKGSEVIPLAKPGISEAGIRSGQKGSLAGEKAGQKAIVLGGKAGISGVKAGQKGSFNHGSPVN